jgi:hypothetical protein
LRKISKDGERWRDHTSSQQKKERSKKKTKKKKTHKEKRTQNNPNKFSIKRHHVFSPFFRTRAGAWKKSMPCPYLAHLSFFFVCASLKLILPAFFCVFFFCVLFGIGCVQIRTKQNEPLGKRLGNQFDVQEKQQEATFIEQSRNVGGKCRY